MVFFEIIFWTLLLILIYTYLGYPILLYVLTIFRKSPIEIGNELPSLTFILSVYNEETVIEKKIDNTLSLDYPARLIQIVVVSDGSTDKTNELVRKYQDIRVHLILNNERRGKTYSLNRAIEVAAGEILIFTDANAMFESRALRKMVRNFADPFVGLVTGSTRYFAREDSGNLILSMGLYTRLERWIKKMETKVGSCVGADGAVFALRKAIFRPLADTDINDFVIPLSTLRQGYRVVFDEDVFCLEEHSTDISKEFRRQIRISNRTIWALINNRDLLNPIRHGLFSWMLFSHKALRFLFPVIFILGLVINVILIFSVSLWYLTVFSGFLGIIVISLLSSRLEHKLFSLIRSFFYTNLAILVAWQKVLTNQTFVTWGIQRKSRP